MHKSLETKLYSFENIPTTILKYYYQCYCYSSVYNLMNVIYKYIIKTIGGYKYHLLGTQ